MEKTSDSKCWENQRQCLHSNQIPSPRAHKNSKNINKMTGFWNLMDQMTEIMIFLKFQIATTCHITIPLKTEIQVLLKMTTLALEKMKNIREPLKIKVTISNKSKNKVKDRVVKVEISSQDLLSVLLMGKKQYLNVK